MIITLIADQKNLGIMTLTDHIIEKLGRDNCAVVGTNYLVKSIKPTLDLIDSFSKSNKSVVVKYVVPKKTFNNQNLDCPKEIDSRSDIILRVPTFMEEIKRPINLEIFKGEENPFIERIREYYK
ncbi:hypothetical protein N9948_00495 [bacterium]|nr:hypothetical protein [bacterium]